jgi:hypothetical protein
LEKIEIYDYYSSINKIGIIKPRRMRLEGHAACMEGYAECMHGFAMKALMKEANNHRWRNIVKRILEK